MEFMGGTMVKEACDLLAEIYQLHEQYTRGQETVCGPGCAACCTCNVTMTSLEYAFVVRGMGDGEQRALRDRAMQGRAGKRFQPAYTINKMAALCLDGKELPQEENNPAWGRCPLLREEMCTIYETRPLGCRMLLSQTRCRQVGYAQMPPFVVTVNNLFMQVVEHLDAQGTSGNLTDMILWQADGQGADAGVSGRPSHILNNSRAPVFMVPPEHRERVRPLMGQLSRILEGQEKR